MPYKDPKKAREANRKSYRKYREQRLARSKEWRSKTNSAYGCWLNMKQRCTNPNIRDFKRYGARGISVCSQWADFNKFIEDLGPRPTTAYSLDRINNDGNYEPGNVRWATNYEQAQNSSRTQLLTFKGTTLSLRAWGRRLGVYHQKVKQILGRNDAIKT